MSWKRTPVAQSVEYYWLLSLPLHFPGFGLLDRVLTVGGLLPSKKKVLVHILIFSIENANNVLVCHPIFQNCEGI